ncbi:hypothetical protein [uncultured Fusobacterium sp.]|uniref:hypothetical protein n=1 Tax=uncultured Fusobacterium sp. TaxID=159267 RepID=UPI0025E0A31D|nr:hypothetical protein [uncultured Fusobacterium sp.]
MKIEAFKRVNDKLEPISDKLLNKMSELFGEKLPQFLARNIVKIYILAFIVMILAMIQAYHQRGYLAFGGEVMIMLLPAMLDMYLAMREDSDE